MTKITAREIALKVIYDVNEEGAYANLALDKALFQCKELDARDKGLITEIVYGSIKYRGRLDWIINQSAKVQVQKMDPWVRNIIRQGLYQMMFLNKVPVSAAVNEAVELTKKYSHSGSVKFVNGVLRNIERQQGQYTYPNKGKQPVQYLAVYYSFPQWILEKWVKQYGVKKTEELCQYFNQPSPLWIRTNTLKTTVEQLKQWLVEREIVVEQSSHVPEGLKIISNVNLHQLDLFQQGYFTVQDESSMLVALAAKPKPEQWVMDVCSAPGGKTTHMAQMMNNTGKIMACDIHEHRLALIEDNCQRMGIHNVVTRLQDGEHLAENFQPTFDVVLVDAPCSGLGVLGRRPDARWNKRLSDIVNLTVIQRNILEQAAQVVAKDGTLIYSTCTTIEDENQLIIQQFLEKHPEFELDQQLNTCWTGIDKGSEGYVQFLPFEDHMDGFFIAKLIKKAE